MAAASVGGPGGVAPKEPKPISAEDELRDLGMNLALFQQSVKEGKLNSADIDSLSKFFDTDLETVRDLKEIKASSYAIKQIDEFKAALKEVTTSFIDLEPQSLEDRIHSKKPVLNRDAGNAAAVDARNELRQGATNLNAKYDICPIKGDGHCLFRSIAAGLMYNLSSLSAEERKLYWVALSEKIPDGKEDLLDLFEKFRRMVNDAITNKSTTAFNVEPDASIPVEFLRKMACEFMRNNPDMMDFIVEGERPGYLYKMATTPAWGGQPEIAALANMLGIRIRTVNLQLAGRGVDERTYETPIGHQTPSGLKMPIVLIYDGDPSRAHYELGIERRQQRDAARRVAEHAAAGVAKPPLAQQVVLQELAQQEEQARQQKAAGQAGQAEGSDPMLDPKHLG